MVALAALLLTGCMDKEWSEPTNQKPFGNEQLTEHNIISVKDLKEKYDSYISPTTSTLSQITEDIQIKAKVTGNDVGGNIYSEVAVDDGTGVILICVAEGGLFGYLPVGQEILVDLKDLYIGAYGQQAQIGTQYTNARGQTYVSRMNRHLWQKHFKLLDFSGAQSVTPELFDTSRINDQDYLKNHSGKLMTIKGVQFKGADGNTVYASKDEKDAANCVNRALVGFNDRSLVVRTSTYADFAAQKLPQGKVDITGIFTRFRNTWQILIRSIEDVKPAK